MKNILLATALLAVSAPAFALFGTLTSQTVNGALRYCYYSNGVVVTIKSHQLCPVTNG